MGNKKRVFCLYRVSKRIQAENDDIPMQKQACHEFVERQGWEIVKEFYEKGVSGFSVSSTKRDALLEIQREAAMNNFDILLVFMFDRLGRRDDETPFVVEWFIRNNIEVWSVNEGEQRLDSHVDKLLNYIHYWQASGESINFSIRVKAGIAKIAKQGYFAGGFVPFGYRLIKSGRINHKNGKEVWDYAVDEESADIVRTVFSKYANEGYGCQKLARYLYAQGIVKPNGKEFCQQNMTKMLRNQLYLGYVKRGETRVRVPGLQIIDNDTFEKAMLVRKARNIKRDPAKRSQMAIKSEQLLSGNIFCGHCGHKLSLSFSRAKYSGNGYVCTVGQGRGGSTCQQKYLSSKVDGAVRGVLKQIFAKIQDTPPAYSLEKQHQRTSLELNGAIQTVAKSISKLNKDLSAYKSEVINVIQGNSAFTAETLNQLIADMGTKLAEQTAEHDRLQTKLNESDSLHEKTKEERMRIRSWCEIFDESSLETQKMVALSIIKEVRLWKGYQMEIDLNLSVKEFADGMTFDYEKINVSVGE